MMKWILALVATLAFTAQAAAADKVVLMLNWYVYGEHAPFYYGKAKGIYAAENIDLEIQEGRGSAATTQAVAAKTAPSTVSTGNDTIVRDCNAGRTDAAATVATCSACSHLDGSRPACAAGPAVTALASLYGAAIREVRQQIGDPVTTCAAATAADTLAPS